MIAEKTNYELLSELVSNQSKVEEILNHYSQNFLMITRATSIITGHNHPSGNKNPSSADKNLSNQLKSAGKYIQINLTDFLIIGNNDYLSFQDEGIF